MSETKGAIWKEAKHPRRSLPPMVGHARPAPSNAHTRSRVESPRALVVGSLHVDSKKVGDKPSVCTLVRDTLVRDTYSTITLIRCFISVARNRGNRFCSPRHAIFFFLPLTLSTVDRAIFFPRRNPSDDASFGIDIGEIDRNSSVEDFWSKLSFRSNSFRGICRSARVVVDA